MKKYFLVLCFMFGGLDAQDTKAISSAEASKYIGEIKTVRGTVVSGYYAYRSKGKRTFLNLDKAYPNQIFTIVIWQKARTRFGQARKIII